MRSNLDSSSRESANPPYPRAGRFSLAGRVDRTTGAEDRECFVPDANACEASAARPEGEREVNQNRPRIVLGGVYIMPKAGGVLRHTRWISLV